jgi:hypothetical protein
MVVLERSRYSHYLYAGYVVPRQLTQGNELTVSFGWGLLLGTGLITQKPLLIFHVFVCLACFTVNSVEEAVLVGLVYSLSRSLVGGVGTVRRFVLGYLDNSPQQEPLPLFEFGLAGSRLVSIAVLAVASLGGFA